MTDDEQDNHKLIGDPVIDLAAAKDLLEISSIIRGTLGRLLALSIDENPQKTELLIDHMTIDNRLEAAHKVFQMLLYAFIEVIDNSVIGQMGKISNNTPEDARAAVLSWVSLIAPLIEQFGPKETSRYTPLDLSQALFAIKPEILQDALWAPTRAKQIDDKKGIAVDRLTAINIERFLVSNGHDLDRVRHAIQNYYGADWDAIRKWEAPSKKEIGEETAELIRYDPNKQNLLIPNYNHWPLVDMFIFLAGASYRRRMGATSGKKMFNEAELQELFEHMTVDPDWKPQESRLQQMSREIRNAASLALKDNEG